MINFILFFVKSSEMYIFPQDTWQRPSSVLVRQAGAHLNTYVEREDSIDREPRIFP